MCRCSRQPGLERPPLPSMTHSKRPRIRKMRILFLQCCLVWWSLEVVAASHGRRRHHGQDREVREIADQLVLDFGFKRMPDISTVSVWLSLFLFFSIFSSLPFLWESAVSQYCVKKLFHSTSVRKDACTRAPRYLRQPDPRSSWTTAVPSSSPSPPGTSRRRRRRIPLCSLVSLRSPD